MTTIRSHGKVLVGAARARRKASWLLGLMGSLAAVSILIAGPADASTVASNWANYARGTTCTVYAYLDQTGTTFTAGAQVPCATKYANTGLYVELQWWNSSQTYPQIAKNASVYFTNSYGTGSHILWTKSSTPSGHGCLSYRAVAQARINADPGLVMVQSAWRQVCI